MMRDQVRFKTTFFSAPSDESPNGIELAKWVCSVLPLHLDADFMDEDWGCRVLFHNPQLAKISLGCGHVEMNQWSIAAFIDRSILDKLFHRPKPIKKLEEIIRALDSAVSNEPRFAETEWFENDSHLAERNHASRAFDLLVHG